MDTENEDTKIIEEMIRRVENDPLLAADMIPKRIKRNKQAKEDTKIIEEMIKQKERDELYEASTGIHMTKEWRSQFDPPRRHKLPSDAILWKVNPTTLELEQATVNTSKK